MATNIFPLYLDGAPVTLSGAPSVTPTTSFYILATGAVVTLLDAEKVGTIVNFTCPNSTTDATVTLSNPVDGTSSNTFTFANSASTATAIYFPDGWRWVSYAGGSVS